MRVFVCTYEGARVAYVRTCYVLFALHSTLHHSLLCVYIYKRKLACVGSYFSMYCLRGHVTMHYFITLMNAYRFSCLLFVVQPSFIVHVWHEFCCCKLPICTIFGAQSRRYNENTQEEGWRRRLVCWRQDCVFIHFKCTTWPTSLLKDRNLCVPDVHLPGFFHLRSDLTFIRFYMSHCHKHLQTEGWKVL